MIDDCLNWIFSIYVVVDLKEWRFPPAFRAHCSPGELTAADSTESVTALWDYRSCPLVSLISFPEFPGLISLSLWSPLAAHSIYLVKTFLFTFLFKSIFDGHRACLLTSVSDPGSKQKMELLRNVIEVMASRISTMSTEPMLQGLWQAIENITMANA